MADLTAEAKMDLLRESYSDRHTVGEIVGEWRSHFEKEKENLIAYGGTDVTPEHFAQVRRLGELADQVARGDYRAVIDLYLDEAVRVRTELSALDTRLAHRAQDI